MSPFPLTLDTLEPTDEKTFAASDARNGSNYTPLLAANIASKRTVTMGQGQGICATQQPGWPGVERVIERPGRIYDAWIPEAKIAILDRIEFRIRAHGGLPSRYF